MSQTQEVEIASWSIPEVSRCDVAGSKPETTLKMVM